jgi:hypothetical protein
MQLFFINISVLLAVSLFIQQSFTAEFPVLLSYGNLSDKINSESAIRYSLEYIGSLILKNSTILLQFDQSPVPGKDMNIVSGQTSSFDEISDPVFGRYSSIRNHCSQLILLLKEEKYTDRELKWPAKKEIS